MGTASQANQANKLHIDNLSASIAFGGQPCEMKNH